MRGRVLSVAGSDSGGGAGIQADIKTITALRGYGATAITALTAQNTLGVQEVLAVPAAFVAAQMRAVLDDIGADAIKTGMLGDAGIITAVADVLAARPPIALVVDPVMVAKGGARLLDPNAIDVLRARLFSRASLITPNLPEAEALLGMRIGDEASMLQAGQALAAQSGAAVLMKGGHAPGDSVVDLLIAPAGVWRFEDARQPGRHTHGTGCTLASAIATRLAQGADLLTAVSDARQFVQAAIAAAPGLGGGHGPLNHAVAPAGGE